MRVRLCSGEMVQYSVGYWGANAYFSELATARAIDNPTSLPGLLPQLADLSESAAYFSHRLLDSLRHPCSMRVGRVSWVGSSLLHPCRTGNRSAIVVMGHPSSWPCYTDCTTCSLVTSLELA